MSDPQPPENLPARPPAAAPGFLAPADGSGTGDRRRARAHGGTPAQSQDSFEERPAVGRHAPPSSAPAGTPAETSEPAFGFAPPSSPGFGAPVVTGGAGYDSTTAAREALVQQPPQPQYGQPQYGQPQYGYQYPPSSFPAQQYPQTALPAQQYPPANVPTEQYLHNPAYQTPGVNQMAQIPPVAKAASRRATTALTLGVIGVIGGIFFGWTLPLSVVAIVLGFLARSREPHARGTALGAIVTGFVGVVLSIGWLAYSILTWLALTAS